MCKLRQARAHLLMHTYRGTIKRMLTSCITVGYGVCTASCYRTLQRIVKAVQRSSEDQRCLFLLASGNQLLTHHKSAAIRKETGDSPDQDQQLHLPGTQGAELSSVLPAIAISFVVFLFSLNLYSFINIMLFEHILSICV